jgi:two-component system phosphate regulon response regulator PhoB/two-component system alkaline phosphatase synthesis response regulator PhoP
MLTARGDESDKVVGLELGADDYVTKPFSVKELVARIHAVLRRPGGGEAVRRIVVGTLVIDVDKFEVTAEGAKVDLTATEFKILQLLASRKGRVFSRDQILDFLWGSEKAVIDRTVDVHIRNLREKLGEAAALIKNIRGVGYKLEE